MTADPAGLPPAAGFPPRAAPLSAPSGPPCWKPAIPGSPGLFCLLLAPPRPLPRPAGLLLPQRSHPQLPGALGRPREPSGASSGSWWACSLRLFYRLQRGYDLTAVSSRAMEAALRARGVRRVAHLPFGVPGALPGGSWRPRRPPRNRGRAGRIRLLYAGRLDREKGVDLLLEVLPGPVCEPGGRPGVGGRARGLCRSLRRLRASPLPLPGLPGRPGPGARRLRLPSRPPGARAPSRPSASACWRPWPAASLVVGPDRGGTGGAARGGRLALRSSAPGTRRTSSGPPGPPSPRPGRSRATPPRCRRSRAVAERYGTWDEAVARMVARYAAGGAPGGLPVAADSADRRRRNGGRLISARACSSACTTSRPSTWTASAGPRRCSASWESGKVAYLFVPEYHGGYPSAGDAAFIDWCRADSVLSGCSGTCTATTTWKPRSGLATAAFTGGPHGRPRSLQAAASDGGGGGVPGPGRRGPTRHAC